MKDALRVSSTEGLVGRETELAVAAAAVCELCEGRASALVIEGEAGKVVARVRATGTHQGEFMGMPATGKSVDMQLIDIIRFGDDGLAHEHWGVLDALGMMQQLGAIPATAPA